MWLPVLALFVSVVGTWSKLRALAIWLLMIPVRLAFAVGRTITNPEPLSWQVGNAVDGFAIGLAYRLNWQDPERFPRLFTALWVPLTTWLFDTRAAIDSYRRHLALLRQYGPRPHG